MSKHLYTFLPTEGLSSRARAVYLSFANGGFVLMCLHAGIHIASILPKEMGKSRTDRHWGGFFLRRVCLLQTADPSIYVPEAAVCFLDYSEPVVFFLMDYLSIMILFAMIGYGVTLLLTKNRIIVKTTSLAGGLDLFIGGLWRKVFRMQSSSSS